MKKVVVDASVCLKWVFEDLVPSAVENKIILVSADEKLVQKVNGPNVTMTLTSFSKLPNLKFRS